MLTVNKDYIAHHGILGQKWGKKQGPPYPLDARDHSASEKKAGWKKSLDDSSGSFGGANKKGLFNAAKQIAKAKDNKLIKKLAKTEDKKPSEDKKVKQLNRISQNNQNQPQAQNQQTQSQRPNGRSPEVDAVIQTAIRNSDVKTIRKYQKDMTYQELNEAVNRATLDVRLKQMDNTSTPMKKIQKVANTAVQIADVADKGLRVYDTVAKVNNTIRPDHPLPRVNDQLNAANQIRNQVRNQNQNNNQNSNPFRRQNQPQAQNQQTQHYDPDFDRWTRPSEDISSGRAFDKAVANGSDDDVLLVPQQMKRHDASYSDGGIEFHKRTKSKK